MSEHTGDRTVVVTGVSSGIGHRIVARLIGEGARVFGSVRDPSDAQRLSAEFGERFAPLLFDIRDEAALRSEAERVRGLLGGRTLSGLVDNVGEAIPGPVFYQPMGEIRQQIEVDLIGPIAVTKAFGPLLGADPGLAGLPGRVIMMTSIAGKLAQPFISGYVASKHGLEGFSETLRRELQLFGIDVIIIGPGPAVTPIWDKAEAHLGQYAGTPYADAFDKGVRTLVTVGRQHGLDPDRIADLVWTALTSPHPKPRYAPAEHPVLEQGLMRALPRRWLDRIFRLYLGLRPTR